MFQELKDCQGKANVLLNSGTRLFADFAPQSAFFVFDMLLKVVFVQRTAVVVLLLIHEIIPSLQVSRMPRVPSTRADPFLKFLFGCFCQFHDILLSLVIALIRICNVYFRPIEQAHATNMSQYEPIFQCMMKATIGYHVITAISQVHASHPHRLSSPHAEDPVVHSDNHP